MSCIVKSCRNYRTRRPEEVSFHQFPRDKKLQDCWLQALGIENENFIRSPNKIVCSNHFLKEDFLEFFLKRTLKRNAVPSMNLHSAAPEFVVPKAESEKSDIDSRCSSNQSTETTETSASEKNSITSEHEESATTISSENLETMVKIIHNYSMSPTTLKARNVELTKRLQQYRKRLYSANKKIKTLEKKVTSLEDIRDSLKKHIYLMTPPFS